jgi:hypothetical protein
MSFLHNTFEKKTDLMSRNFIFIQRVQGFFFFSNFFHSKNKMDEKKTFGQVKYLTEKGFF